MEAKIALQQSRFNLIEGAATFDYEDASPYSHQLINIRLEMLEKNWTTFQDEHVNLCLTEGSSLNGHSYIKSRLYERCQAFYVYSRARLLSHRDQMETTTTRSTSMVSDQRSNSALLPRSCLPRITLPTFSGDYQLWRSFSDLFTSLIRDNSSLSTVEKMHYLKTCLSGDAARIVSNLPVSDNNFTIAWDLLVARYENQRLLITAHLDRIMNIKPMKFKTAKGLRAITTTVSEALGALQALGCATSHWDPLLLHHLTRLLDTETREAWEVKLGSSSTCPTYLQFEEFLIARTRALENLDHHVLNSGTQKSSSFPGKYPPNIAAHAIASNYQSECPLCEASHYLAKCDHYLSKTPKQRREVVAKYRRCFNCLGLHAASKCSNPRRCMKCGKKHHTTIHDSSDEVALKQSTIERRKENEKQHEDQPISNTQSA